MTLQVEDMQIVFGFHFSCTCNPSWLVMCTSLVAPTTRRYCCSFVLSFVVALVFGYCVLFLSCAYVCVCVFGIEFAEILHSAATNTKQQKTRWRHRLCRLLNLFSRRIFLGNGNKTEFTICISSADSDATASTLTLQSPKKFELGFELENKILSRPVVLSSSFLVLSRALAMKRNSRLRSRRCFGTLTQFVCSCVDCAALG